MDKKGVFWLKGTVSVGEHDESLPFQRERALIFEQWNAFLFLFFFFDGLSVHRVHLLINLWACLMGHAFLLCPCALFPTSRLGRVCTQSVNTYFSWRERSTSASSTLPNRKTGAQKVCFPSEQPAFSNNSSVQLLLYLWSLTTDNNNLNMLSDSRWRSATVVNHVLLSFFVLFKSMQREWGCEQYFWKFKCFAKFHLCTYLYFLFLIN